MPRDQTTDLTSLASLRLGDSNALNRLIERWQRPLHAFAFRYCQNSEDAEDLVAQTFVRLYQQREKLRADTNLSAWLFTTLTNLCHNHHRWKKRHPSLSFFHTEAPSQRGTMEESLPDESERDSPAANTMRDEELTILRQHIEQLPPELKTALLLHHYEKMSYAEIGAIVGCSERGVETRLYRARNRLRDALQERFYSDR